MTTHFRTMIQLTNLQRKKCKLTCFSVCHNGETKSQDELSRVFPNISLQINAAIRFERDQNDCVEWERSLWSKN